MSTGGADKRRRKRRETYGRFVLRVLRDIHPEDKNAKPPKPRMGMGRKGMAVMNSMLNDLFSRVASEAGRLCEYDHKRTMQDSDVQTAVRFVLPGDLAKNAVSEGTKAVSKFKAGRS